MYQSTNSSEQIIFTRYSIFLSSLLSLTNQFNFSERAAQTYTHLTEGHACNVLCHCWTCPPPPNKLLLLCMNDINYSLPTLTETRLLQELAIKGYVHSLWKQCWCTSLVVLLHVKYIKHIQMHGNRCICRFRRGGGRGGGGMERRLEGSGVKG